MTLEKVMNDFHERINFNLKQLPLSSLHDHGIKIAKGNENYSIRLKIRAFHYGILSTTRSIPTSPMLIKRENTFEEIKQKFFYYERELYEFALLCLYLTNSTLGECIVQRHGKKDVSVIQVRGLTVEQLTNTEKIILAAEIEKLHQKEQITFGADLEVMLQNKNTKKLMNGNMLQKKRFGFDQAIAVHENRVYHPIIEIRPKPSANIEELHSNLLDLHETFNNETEKYQLKVITASFYGRFFLGGHIHFGNIPFTFQHVRLLDQFVTLPFALVENNPSFERRRSYGMIGSVRRNLYQGFEYRALPTWFKLIPSSLPLFVWIQYLMKNAHKLSTSLFEKASLKSYYEKHAQAYSLEDWKNDHKKYICEDKGKILLENYLSYLKNLRNTRESL